MTADIAADQQSQQQRLDAFAAELQERNLAGHWQTDRSRWNTPESRGVPYLWPGADVRKSLETAGELIGLNSDARRTVRLVNPALRETSNTTLHTLHMSVQLVKPGELAAAHRHTMAAIRFVLEGGATVTTVDGDPLEMETRDLILTPQWSWHDHCNDGTGDTVWIDVLDLPLIKFLGCRIQQKYAMPQQEETPATQRSRDKFGLVVPTGDVAYSGRADPAFRYAWTDVEYQLDRLMALQGDPYDGLLLEYANPVTRGHTLPTMSCYIQALRPGEATRVHRHTNSAIFHVLEGTGITTVGDQSLEWSQGDFFVVPNWTWHSFRNVGRDRALLFVTSDLPQFEAFGLLRQETQE